MSVNIITISREFGSGGRELGRMLADNLGYDYYDSEIISTIAKKSGMDEGYVERALSDHGWQALPLTIHRSFSAPAILQPSQANLMAEQKRVIEEIGKAGQNCVIVGRNADILLRRYRPFSIFICADMATKVRRCTERAKEGEKVSAKEVEKHIRRIDANRARTREILSGAPWGAREAHQMILNSTGWDLKELAPLVAQLANLWFAGRPAAE